MSDDQDKDSKTEAPTEKKIRDAFAEGNIPTSREVPIFASALAFYIYLVFFLPKGAARLAETLRDIFEEPDQWTIQSASDLVSLAVRLAWDVSGMLLPVAVLFIAFGIGSNVAQHMPQFVLKRITPQAERISIVKGWGRLFSVQGLVEFGKSLFKIIIVSIIMVVILHNDYFRSIDALFSDPQVIIVTMMRVMKKIMIVILFATAIVAVADFFWTRHHWYTMMRMTKQEVKDEFKQSQGDPIVKARIRSIGRDRARRRMMANVPRATLVIANPTHYAVALRYAQGESDAPVVLAKGQDLVALKIREVAEANNIPIFEDPPLARSMFAQVTVDGIIPPPFYKAVAELIHKVYALRARRGQRR
ncbi:flagellar biosynthesis protein FlhB [Neorhizobium sp. NCHU2750]|uniref:flagellar biosynthesis protein FlhB n=1 Tax=Neorhizobium sp. NCHU2750 TaxID=1825976 RepID=UPI000E752355|nr:flagellar biosynthesis protein [Neorhizobium sp. NCHU2750]